MASDKPKAMRQRRALQAVDAMISKSDRISEAFAASNASPSAPTPAMINALAATVRDAIEREGVDQAFLIEHATDNPSPEAANRATAEVRPTKNHPGF